MIHGLKILPRYFRAVTSGDKKFEVRRPDREYEVGDFLALNEYDDELNEYTGRCCLVKVTYILDRGVIMDADDVIVMSFTPCQIISSIYEKPKVTELGGVPMYERTAIGGLE